MTPSDRLLMAALAVMLSLTAPAIADEPTSPRLNSERIEQRFGSYGIELLNQTETVRVANLYSLDEGVTVTRTFAVTRHADSIDARLRQAHERILAGASIGATLADAGWTVERRHLWMGDLPATSGISALMRIDGPTRLGVHIFDLEISRESERMVYATIAEIHHPDYLDHADIERLFGPAAGESDERAAFMLQLALNQMLEPQWPAGD